MATSLINSPIWSMIDPLLGTMPDSRLAQQFGLCDPTIRKQRIDLNIPEFRAPKLMRRVAIGCPRKTKTGDRFGSLVAVREVSEDETRANVYWLFRCDCGESHTAEIGRVRRGKSPTACRMCRKKKKKPGANKTHRIAIAHGMNI